MSAEGSSARRSREGADAGPARRAVPDFFIVGHHKCGTTALYQMLRCHPQIFMPELKEPKFLASDMPARLEPPAASPLPRTLEHYLELFSKADPRQRAGEASPSYLTSRTAAQTIAQLQPEARIIAILREPASFLRSYTFSWCSPMSSRTRTCATRSRTSARRARRPHLFPRLYSDSVRYVEQLRRYHALFPPIGCWS